MDIPYCIVKGKARLGQLVRRKQCTSVAFSEIKNSPSWLKPLKLTTTNEPTKSGNTGVVEFWAPSPKPNSTSDSDSKPWLDPRKLPTTSTKFFGRMFAHLFQTLTIF